MKVITAPIDYNRKKDDICIFLAGGITNCPNWQNEVINELKKYKIDDDLILFNPRRKNFPINNPNAAEEQITWEFKYLSIMDIFSMYFTGGDSDQPICMYELGRYTLWMKNRFKSYKDRIIVSVEDDYNRKKDVQIQMKLACKNADFVFTNSNPKKHAEKIYNQYIKMKLKKELLYRLSNDNKI